MLTTLRRLTGKYRQLLLYGILGGLGALTDLVVYSLFVHFTAIPPTIASAISTTGGIVTSFLLNNRYNFKKHDHIVLRFTTFYAVGLVGIVLSVALIFILFNVLGMGPILAKLISIPPVVLAQYFLNKHVSFSEEPRKFWARLYRLCRGNSWLLAVNVLLLLLLTFFMKHTIDVQAIPSADRTAKTYQTQPPDESTHYLYNVKFILEHHRLPVSGKDDISALKFCQTDPTPGKVPCMYSYEVYPATPYLIAVVGAKIGQSIGMNPAMGARLPGLAYGLILFNFLYLAVYRITRRKGTAILLASAVSFIPQVLFTLTYLNLDAFSLAVAAILAYSVVRYAQRPDRAAILWLGIAAGGLLSVSKYSFFVLLIPAAAVTLYLTAVSPLHRRALPKLILSLIVSFLVIGAFWYVRNLVLYHDPIGQHFTLTEMAKYHPLNQAWPLNLHTWSYFSNQQFLGQSFRSFFVSYGPLLYFISTAVYDILSLGLFLLAVYFLSRAVILRHRRLLLAWLLSLVTFLLVLGQSIYNSAVYDFQPQGRYLFPILFPFILYIAYHWSQDKQATRYVPVLLAGAISYVLLLGLDLYIGVYL